GVLQRVVRAAGPVALDGARRLRPERLELRGRERGEHRRRDVVVYLAQLGAHVLPVGSRGHREQVLHLADLAQRRLERRAGRGPHVAELLQQRGQQHFDVAEGDGLRGRGGTDAGTRAGGGQLLPPATAVGERADVRGLLEGAVHAHEDGGQGHPGLVPGAGQRQVAGGEDVVDAAAGPQVVLDGRDVFLDGRVGHCPLTAARRRTAPGGGGDPPSRAPRGPAARTAP